jgi:hypothetical protein
MTAAGIACLPSRVLQTWSEQAAGSCHAPVQQGPAGLQTCRYLLTVPPDCRNQSISSCSGLGPAATTAAPAAASSTTHSPGVMRWRALIVETYTYSFVALCSHSASCACQGEPARSRVLAILCGPATRQTHSDVYFKTFYMHIADVALTRFAAARKDTLIVTLTHR